MPSSACQKCARSEEHTSELQSHSHLVCRLLLEKKIALSRGPRRGPVVIRRAGGTVRRSRRATQRVPVLLGPPVGLSPLASVPSFFFFNGTGAPRNLPLSPPQRSSV